jgi:DNA/RNA-binding domain of Phe-tRNA-synthetase-like protein
MVTTATRDALVVVYAPIDVGLPQLERVLQVTAGRIASVCGGRESAAQARHTALRPLARPPG